MSKRSFRSIFASTGTQIPIAVVLALITGTLINKFCPDAPKEARLIAGLPGEVWIRALKSIVVPLILCSMISSMQSLKKMPGGGGKIAKYALTYYFTTTIFALILAVVFIMVILVPNMKPIDIQELLKKRPEYANQAAPENTKSILDRILDIIKGIVPENIIKIMADNDLIAVITTGVVMGVLINDTEDNPSVIVRFVKEIEKIVFIVVSFLVKISPIGIFSLIIPPLMEQSIEQILTFVGWYFITVFSCLAFHLFVVYPLIYFVLIRKNPFPFFKAFMPAGLTAFGTGSSAAAMPVSLECAARAGIRSDIASFLVPLGVSLNMDGSAIGLPIGVAFMAVGLGVKLGALEYCMLIFTGFLATVGAAPIPAASLVFYMMMMSAINLPMNALFPLLAATDFMTERPITVLNIIGDTVAMAIAQKYCLNSDIDSATVDAHNVENGKAKRKN